MPRPTLLRWIPALNSGANHPRSLSLLALGVGLAACSGNAEPPPASGGSNSSAGSPAAGSGAGGLPGTAGTTFGGSAGSMSTPGGAATNAGSGGGSSAPGGTGGTGSTGGTGGGPIDASFNGFKSLIPTSCFGGLCHDLPEHPLQLKLDDNLYTTLTTHVTKECGPLITKGSPQQSALVKLLKGPCGKTDRMPYGKCISDGDEGCVSPENIAAIEQWITQGAPQ